MALIRPMLDLDTASMGERYFQGVVVDNNDPDKLHRIKIRIEEIHGDEQQIPDEHLPWAIHFRPTFLGGGADLSMTALPRPGSTVIISHIRGDIYQPAYMFELAHNSNRMTQAEQNYPESYVFRDSDDNFYHVDMVDDKLDIKFNGTEALQITVDRGTIIGRDDTETIGRDKTKTVERDETNHVKRNRSTEVDVDETKTVHGGQSNIVDLDKTNNVGQNVTENIGTSGSGNLTQDVKGTKTVTATTLIITTTANVAITAGSEVTVDAPSIKMNGGAGVLTKESINPLTGVPFPDGSSTVFAGDG